MSGSPSFPRKRSEMQLWKHLGPFHMRTLWYTVFVENPWTKSVATQILVPRT